MTIHVIVAVRDTQLNAFDRPFAAPTAGAALRAFMDEVNNPNSALNKHPEDYALFQLGTYNDETGKHSDLDAPKQLASGKEVKILASET